ncbi:MAG: response regulator [Blastocatellia bacterium]
MGDPTQSNVILVIDDDVEWTDLLRIFFSEKYDVRIANHADDAIDTIQRDRPKLIVLDLVMPSVDGFGFMRRLNEMSIAATPTVLLTGWDSVEIRECATAVGCAAVLSKPVSLEKLDEVISAIILREVI